MKELTITSGARQNPVAQLVRLNGMSPDEPLTPSMARYAAMMATGHTHGVTVYDHTHDIGYRVTARSTRRLAKD